MTLDHYIWDPANPYAKPVTANLLTWAMWFEHCERHVALTRTCAGTCQVSTVFLGLDHSFSNHGPPVLFESLVFGGAMDGEMNRYETYAQAVVGHWHLIYQLQTISIPRHLWANVKADFRGWWQALTIEARSWFSSEKWVQLMAQVDWRSRRR